MSWNCEIYQKIFTEWFRKEFYSRGYDKNWAKAGRSFNFTGKPDNGRTLKMVLEEGKPKYWRIAELCKIANEFDEHPSYLLAQIELDYKMYMKNHKKSTVKKLKKISQK